MRSSFLLSVGFLLLFSAFHLEAREAKSSPELWITGGWGGGDGDLSPEDYSMLSMGVRIQFPNRLFIIRGEYGRAPLFKKGADYKFKEVKAMWGYSKSFPESGIYVATGISYSHHQIQDMIIPDQGPLPEPAFSKQNVWGMPIELGTHIKITDGFTLGGSGFINLNATDVYVGYLIQAHFRLF